MVLYRHQHIISTDSKLSHVFKDCHRLFVERKLFQRECFWIHILNTLSPLRLNEEFDIKPFLSVFFLFRYFPFECLFVFPHFLELESEVFVQRTSGAIPSRVSVRPLESILIILILVYMPIRLFSLVWCFLYLCVSPVNMLVFSLEASLCVSQPL